MTVSATGPGKWVRESGELSGRDLAILRDVGLVRLLTGRHVQRLHFHDGSPLTQARRSRSSLQRLSANGWLVRLERRVGGVHGGSAGLTFALSAKGQRLITQLGPASGRRLRRPWEPSGQFIDHVLAGSELYVWLREQEAQGHIDELRYEAEPRCWRYWTGPAGERLVLKPDSFLSFAIGDYDHGYFVEVDRASQSQSVIRMKGLVYSEFHRSGTEQRKLGYFPRVLFVTTTKERKALLIQTLSRLDASEWKLFQVKTMDQTFKGEERSPPDEEQLDRAI